METLNPPRQIRKERNQSSQRKEIGTRVVIAGGLAAIVLWMIVLALGSPIRPFVNPVDSFGYVLLVSAPAIFLSLVAISKKTNSKTS